MASEEEKLARKRAFPSPPSPTSQTMEMHLPTLWSGASSLVSPPAGGTGHSILVISDLVTVDQSTCLLYHSPVSACSPCPKGQQTF